MPGFANKWDQRISRARELAAAYPFAAQILHFYIKVAEFQKGCYLQFQSACGSACGHHTSLPPALDAVDLNLLGSRFGPFLSMLEREAPASLAEFASQLSARGPAACSIALSDYWQDVASHQADSQPTAMDPGVGIPGGYDDSNPLEQFCAHTFLQPYAELLADQADLPEPAVRRPACPFCRSRPLAGILRQEGDGAKRSLICSFCRTEWDYLRIACPACEEADEKKLCVYASDRFPQVRVEACDACRTYIKTVDLTKDGRAVPEVYELPSIPLSLWATERGYTKISRNLVGL